MQTYLFAMADLDDNILQENLFFLTGALSRKLSKEADDVFATVGLSSSHALILLLVRQEPGIQPSQLAEKLHLKPSTITRLVAKLERRKLVGKTSEGRATTIVCTSDGQEMAGSIVEKWSQLLQEKQEQLGERYVEVLSEMIANALDSLDNE